MKKIAIFTLVGLLLLAIPVQSQPHRKKIAIVLSGGGAKGFAHIGALKVIERAGIPVDIVTGTSMGSIIGGLYSIGYDSQLMDSIVRQQDWTLMLSDKIDVRDESLKRRQKQNTYIITRDVNFGKKKPTFSGGLIEGKNLRKLFEKLAYRYRDSIDFNKLPIPFACVSTDIIGDAEYVYHSGSLIEAMRASMAIPGGFTPIRKGEMVLVDGGMSNNFPVDVARKMGADVVIGLSVQEPDKTADDLTRRGSVIGQIIDINCKKKYDENVKNTDIFIRSCTDGYGTTSFSKSAIDTLIRRGEEAAMKQWDQLVKLRDELGIKPGQRAKYLTEITVDTLPQKVKLANVVFEKVDAADQKFTLRKFHLLKRDSINTGMLQKIANSMRADFYYNDADCYLTPTDAGECLHIAAIGDKTKKARLGVRFDTEELVALQANLGLFVRNKFLPMAADFTLRLGKRSMARADFSLYFNHWGKVNASYVFRHQDINIYDKGDRDANIIYNQHTVSLIPFDFNIRNFNFQLGTYFDFYRYNAVLQDAKRELWQINKRNQHFITYQASVKYNSEDKWYFPTRGAKFEATYGYHTNNFVGYDEEPGFRSVNAMWRISFALNNRLTIQPMLYGRGVFGKNPPYILQTVIGGNNFNYYAENQHLPFAGISYLELVRNKFVAAQLRFQQRIIDHNFIIAKVGVYKDGDKMDDIFDHSLRVGVQAAYYYQSIAGPLGGSIGWTTKTKQPNFYINLGFVF